VFPPTKVDVPGTVESVLKTVPVPVVSPGLTNEPSVFGWVKRLPTPVLKPVLVVLANEPSVVPRLPFKRLPLPVLNPVARVEVPGAVERLLKTVPRALLSPGVTADVPGAVEILLKRAPPVLFVADDVGKIVVFPMVLPLRPDPVRPAAMTFARLGLIPDRLAAVAETGDVAERFATLNPPTPLACRVAKLITLCRATVWPPRAAVALDDALAVRFGLEVLVVVLRAPEVDCEARVNC